MLSQSFLCCNENIVGIGLVQLEALEGLFATSESKVRGFIEMLPKESADPLKAELMKIKQIFDRVEDNDDGKLLNLWRRIPNKITHLFILAK